MAKPSIMDRLRRIGGGGQSTRVSPYEVLGAMGTAVYGGYVQDPEGSSALKGYRRYQTYSDMLANTSIVAAGVRYFLNLTAKSRWSMVPSTKEGVNEDEAARIALLCEELLFDDPKTPWHRVIRRAAMYRFYGFSIQEWTAKKRDDGIITMADIRPRPQKTIERWDIDQNGDVAGVMQRSPQDSREIYLPRGKLLYVVDDTLSDSPEGLGIFRHLAAPAKRLERYEQLEGVGFETDLRGIPLGRGPFTQLAQMVKDGSITEADRLRIEEPLRDFMENHIKGPKLGMMLDSMPYLTQDDKASPSAQKQWDLELLKAGSTGQEAVAEAINRVNREMARVLGVEQLLLGESSTGSHALSKDKTQSFFMLVNGTLNELTEAVKTDLLTVLFQLNGWDMALMPTPSCEAVSYQDVEIIAGVLRDMATAGATLDMRDPAVGEIRDLLGVSRTPQDLLDEIEEDAMLQREAQEASMEAERAKAGLPGRNKPKEDKATDPDSRDGGQS